LAVRARELRVAEVNDRRLPYVVLEIVKVSVVVHWGSGLVERISYAASSSSSWRKIKRSKSGTANEYFPHRFLKIRPASESALSI
jgi:hypothetical protein